MRLAPILFAFVAFLSGCGQCPEWTPWLQADECLYATTAGSDTSGTTGESTTGTCADGTERCSCYGNNTCNDGLMCQEGICVPEQDPTGSSTVTTTGDPTTGNTMGGTGTETTTGDPTTGGQECQPIDCDNLPQWELDLTDACRDGIVTQGELLIAQMVDVQLQWPHADDCFDNDTVDHLGWGLWHYRLGVGFNVEPFDPNTEADTCFWDELQLFQGQAIYAHTGPAPGTLSPSATDKLVGEICYSGVLAGNPATKLVIVHNPDGMVSQPSAALEQATVTCQGGENYNLTFVNGQDEVPITCWHPDGQTGTFEFKVKIADQVVQGVKLRLSLAAMDLSDNTEAWRPGLEAPTFTYN